MKKINPIKMSQPCKSVIKTAKPTKKAQRKASSELESALRSTFNLSTEELGFFTYNGKKVDIIFPR